MKPLCAVWSRGGRHFSQRVGGVYGHSAFDNSERCLQAKGGREGGREAALVEHKVRRERGDGETESVRKGTEKLYIFCGDY